VPQNDSVERLSGEPGLTVGGELGCAQRPQCIAGFSPGAPANVSFRVSIHIYSFIHPVISTFFYANASLRMTQVTARVRIDIFFHVLRGRLADSYVRSQCTACYQLRARKTVLLRESTLSPSRITVCRDICIQIFPRSVLLFFARRWQQGVERARTLRAFWYKVPTMHSCVELVATFDPVDNSVDALCTVVSDGGEPL
jgi:hypothetical protein